MSIKEQNINSKKVIITSNESSNKNVEVPIKTSQSMNTESYEYFSQKITTNNNITESSVQASNQNAQNQLLKCTCAQDLLSSQNNQLKCTCNQGITLAQCTCGQGMGAQLKCTCGQSSQKCTCAQSEQKYILSESGKKCTCAQSGQKCNCGLAGGLTTQKKIEIKNASSSSNYNSNASRTQKISVQSVQNKTTINSSKISEEKKVSSISSNQKICNCGNRNDIKASSSIQTTKKTKVTKKKINLNKNNWHKRCVGQNNENLQIIAAERPELLMQCVQDLKVIQEPKPVQILLPIVPNEIDYPLGLEIYGKEKKVLICPENVENLNVSKAYSKIEPHFENLDIAQGDDVHCEKTVQKEEEIINTEINNQKEKKVRYENELAMENGEMFVKGNKDFNKENEVELTTNMNVRGKHKYTWNETNEAIKTTKMNIDKTEFAPTFDNLDIENNEYNYQGQSKTKFTTDETVKESTDETQYPAEYVQKNWNLSTQPMSGRPFTLEKTEKNFDVLKTTKGEKITIKKSYETTDWNKNNNKRREVQINMAKKTKKNPLRKQKVLPITIKGKEENWNDVITEQNDVNLNIEKTEQKKEEFVLTHGEEVSISKEGEDILINDDYNIVEENYTRPIRANIQKVPDVSEESVSSEYDVLKGISKYMGQYQYKELVGESLKVKTQNIIINDISGKYPRRIESYHGLDENFEKFARDQVEIEKQRLGPNPNFNRVNINIQKKIIHQNQGGVRREHYEYSDQQEQEGSNENEYEQESDDKENGEPEDAQEPEQEPDMEQEEQENMDVPEDKDHIPEDEAEHEEMENEIAGTTKEQYYYLKKNEEKNDSEPKDEMENEQDLNQNENEEEEVRDTPVKNEIQSPKENSPKIYIKEITYTKTEQTSEKNEPNLRYITLKKREEDEEEEINKEKEGINQEVEKKENTMNQYLTMPSKKVDEEHISRDGGNDEENELDQELKKKEENEENISMENQGENKAQVKVEIKQEEHIEQQGEQKEEEHLEEKEENNAEQEIAQHEEEHEQENVEHQEEEQVEHNEEENIEHQEEENAEHNEEENAEHNEEEQVEQNEEEQVEENEEGQMEQNEEEEVEHIEDGQIEENNEGENIEHHEENNEEHEEEENNEEHAEEDNVEHIEENHMEEVKKQQVSNLKVSANSDGQLEQVTMKDSKVEHAEEKNLEGQAQSQIGGQVKLQIEGQAQAQAQIGGQVKVQIEGQAQAQIAGEAKAQLEEHEEGNIAGGEKVNKVLIIQNKKIVQGENELHNEEQGKMNVQEKREMNIETTKKEKSISNIVAEAIQAEMRKQELKGANKIKMTSENISLKKSNIDPADNYTKITQSKISLPSGGMVTKTVIHQKIETTSSNTNPMIYSFGQGSIEKSHSNENQNSQYINLANQGSSITFGHNGSISSNLGNNLNNSNQMQYESNYISKSNLTGSNLNMSGKYYFSKGYSSHTYSGRSSREPMDTIKGRKKMENEMKAGYEFDELKFGPRDSKRK